MKAFWLISYTYFHTTIKGHLCLDILELSVHVGKCRVMCGNCFLTAQVRTAKCRIYINSIRTPGQVALTVHTILCFDTRGH